MNNPLHIVVCIQGPTGSGKSELAEALAQVFEVEIVSADSMQIYRGMDIGTAKVPVEKRTVPYHCIDLVEPGEPYSAALFQKDARRAIQEIQRNNKTPILCGGTGFYVRAVLDDMNFAPGDTESAARNKYSQMAREIGADALHAHLKELDSDSAALIHPNNVRRTIRALEMLEEGESYAERKHAFKSVPACIPSIKFALDVDRELLYERIDKRVGEMIEHGLVEEVRGLLDSGFRSGITAPQAIGYKEIVSYIDGEITLDEACEQIRTSTRHYAKRQISWLRSDSEIIWLHADDGITDKLVESAVAACEKHRVTHA